MERPVLFHPRAARDLTEIHDYIALEAGLRTARRFVGRIRDYCLGFSTFPARGSLREDIGPGVRVVGFRRQVSIVFRVNEDAIWIVGVYYGGRNIDRPDVEDEGR